MTKPAAENISQFPPTPTPLTPEQIINQKYTNLCAVLGDAMLKQEQIEKLISDTKAKIDNLNSTIPLLPELKQAQEESRG